MRITMLQNHTEPRTSESGAVVQNLYVAGATYEVDAELGARLLDERKAYPEGEEPPKPEPRPLRGTDGRRPTLIGGKRFYDHVIETPASVPPVQARGEDGRRPSLVGGKRIFGEVVPAEPVTDSDPRSDEEIENEAIAIESDPVDDALEDSFDDSPELDTEPEDDSPDPEAQEPEED